MLILSGKSASGKSFLADYLCKKHGFTRLITYTSRPPRPKEKDGVDYHFINREEFTKKVREGFFAEWQQYRMANGEFVMYGTAKVDVENAQKETLVILTPKGCADLAEAGVHNVFIEYIYANDATIKTRLKKRGDAKDEVERRIKADREDFKGFEGYCDKLVYNNEPSKIKDVAKKAVELYKESVIWRS